MIHGTHDGLAMRSANGLVAGLIICFAIIIIVVVVASLAGLGRDDPIKTETQRLTEEVKKYMER